jgi:Phage T7 tail fibre protein
MQFLSKVELPGDGSTTLFAVPFPYLDPSHVTMKVDGIPVSFTWVNSSMISVVDAPDMDLLVEITRSTPNVNPMVDFQSGNPVTEYDLDLSKLQLFYIEQELFDSMMSGTVEIYNTYPTVSGPWYDPHDYNDSIEDTLAAIGALEASIKISQSFTISANLSIPSTISPFP